jgi:hypothetical protein
MGGALSGGWGAGLGLGLGGRVRPRGPGGFTGRGGAPAGRLRGSVSNCPAPNSAAPGPAYLGPNDAFLQNARAANPLPGYYDVAVHCSPTGVQLLRSSGVPVLVNHRTLAKIVEGMPDYSGQPIQLISCDTGRLPNGVAQNLSNKMGTNVLAPDTLVWPVRADALPFLTKTSSGQIIIYQPGPGNITVSHPTTIPGMPGVFPTYPPTGQWNLFRPGGGRP